MTGREHTQVIAKTEVVLQIDIAQWTLDLPAPLISPAAQALIDVSVFPLFFPPPCARRPSPQRVCM